MPSLLPACLRAYALAACTLILSVPRMAGGADALSLDEAMQMATQQSAQLAAQRYSSEAAQHAVTPAGELPDPRLFFGVENLPVSGADQFSLTSDSMTMRKIGVMQEFPRAEKRELKGRLAREAAAREAAMLRDTHAALRREVALAWMKRYFAERMSALLAEQISETELQRDALRAGLKSDRTQPADLLAVETALQRLLDRRAELDKEAARATAMLSRWLGMQAQRPLAQLDDLPVVPNLDNLPAHIERHPHAETLDRQIDLAQTQARLAQAARRPDWSIEVAYAQRGPGFSNMVSLQVSIDLPILQSRRKYPEIASRLAQVEQARKLREEGLRDHIAEAKAVWTEWQSAQQRIARFDDTLLPLARERANTALAAYRGGRGDLGAVLEARRMELEIKLQRLDLASQAGIAYAESLYFMHAESGQ